MTHSSGEGLALDVDHHDRIGAQRYEGACHLDVEAHMTHSSGEGLALDVDHHDRIGDHTAHSFCTDHAGLHVPHASEAILGYGPTELCLQP